MRKHRLTLLTTLLLPSVALAQVSLQSVIDSAVNNPNDSPAIQQRSQGFEEEFTQQLLDSMLNDQPLDTQDTYDRYYGPDSGYQEDLQRYYEEQERLEHERRIQAERMNERFNTRSTSDSRPLSANRPKEAWQRIQSTTPPPGDQMKRSAGFAIEDHDASDIELLDMATDDNGVMNVNAIPDSSPPPRNNWTLEERERMSECCPASTPDTTWMSVYAFCQKTQLDVDTNGDGRADQGTLIELFSKGTRETPNGRCNVGPPVDNPFLGREIQGLN